MKITELYIKNFGRFSEQHFYIKDGVQVIYGENEYGKSTLQAFIRAMLFGMERGGLSNPDTTFFYILFYNVWIAFGPSLLVYSSAMNDVPPAVTEAAKLDGCGSFREFWNIIFPNIWSTYVVFTVATLATYFGNHLNQYSFYGPNADTKLYTFGYWLFRETELNKATMDNYPFLSAVGVCFTMILVPIVMLIRKCMLKFGPRPD